MALSWKHTRNERPQEVIILHLALQIYAEILLIGTQYKKANYIIR